MTTLADPQSRPAMKVRTITSLGILTAIAFVVTLLSKAIPSFNGFLDYDLKGVIIVMGGFVFGPISAAFMSVLASLIELLTISHTGPIGLIMNVLATATFCCTASAVYKYRHNRAGALMGLVLGGLLMTAVMLLWNYLITPLYMGVPRERVAAMLIPVFLPFNLTKATMNSLAAMILYKPLVGALRNANLIPASGAQQTRGVGVLLAILVVVTAAVLMLVQFGVLPGAAE